LASSPTAARSLDQRILDAHHGCRSIDAGLGELEGGPAGGFRPDGQLLANDKINRAGECRLNPQVPRYSGVCAGQDRLQPVLLTRSNGVVDNVEFG
jgi:hypothetical protein